MTNKHEIKHSSGSKQSKELTERESLSGIIQTNEDRWSILLLSLNVWLVVVLWPLIVVEGSSPLSIILSIAPLGINLFGIHLMGRGNDKAQWILLAAFPIGISAAVASRPESINQQTFTPLVLVFAVVSLSAYGVFTASALTRQHRRFRVNYKPLQEYPWRPAKPHRQWLRYSVIAIVLVGILFISVIGTSSGGYSPLKNAWANAAPQGGLFTSLIGMALSVAVMVFFLGPVLRSNPEPPLSRKFQFRRIISSLILSVIGVLTYLLTQRSID